MFTDDVDLITNRVRCTKCTKIVSCRRTDKLKTQLKLCRKEMTVDNNNVMTEERKRDITQSFVLSIVVENHPLDHLHGDCDRQWLKKLNPKWDPPCNNTVLNLINDIHQQLNTLLKEKVAGTSFLSQTSDSWKSIAKDHYTIVNVHFNDSQTNEPVSVTLGVIPLEVLHVTGKELAKIYKDIYKEFGIVNAKIVETTDGGTNYVEAARLMKHERLHCVNHVINLIVLEVVSEGDTVINKVNKIVNKFNNSSPCLMHLAKAQRSISGEDSHIYKLYNQNDTRWNSTLIMCEQFLKLKLAIVEATNTIKQDKLIKKKIPSLTKHDWKLLKLTINFLTPFLITSKYFESSSHMRIASLIPIVRNLINFCENFNVPKEENDDESFLDLENMKEVAIEELKEKFSNLPTIFLVPSFLHPCHKDINFLTREEAYNVKKLIKAEMKILLQIKELTKQQEKLEDEKSPPRKKQKWNLFGKPDESDEENDESFNQEFETYVSDKCPAKEIENFDEMQWWKSNKERYPTLYKLFLKYSCIRSSQADVERDNSFLGNMITKKRSSLSPETVSKLLFIRNNIKLFPNLF